MSKFKVFVCFYTIIMIVLFGSLCYLMTKVNPPQLYPQPARKVGSEDLVYSDEFLPNDNVGYGMEKVDDVYDSIEVFAKTINENHTNMTTIYPDERNKTNNTKKEIFKLVTESIKHVKGLRRSINQENQQDSIPRSVHLKIKDVDGRPKIEIKVVPEKSNSMKIRTYRNSANITNNALKLDNYDRNNVYDNISKDIIVAIENNEKVVIDFARDSINLYEDILTDDFINANKETDTNLLNDRFISSKTNSIEENVLKENTKITESKQTNVEKTRIMRKTAKNEFNSTEIFNSETGIDTKTKIESTKNNLTTKSHMKGDRQTDQSNAVVSIANTLVGLLIPEATATLPYNYQFIN